MSSGNTQLAVCLALGVATVESMASLIITRDITNYNKLNREKDSREMSSQVLVWEFGQSAKSFHPGGQPVICEVVLKSADTATRENVLLYFLPNATN